MAVKKGKDLDEDIQEDEPGEETPKKKKIPIKLVIIAAMALILIGGGAFAWKGGFLAKITNSGKENETGKKGQDSGKLDIGPIFSMDTFIVNLVDPHGKRYLKLKLELELSSEQVRMEVDKRMPQFKDTILTLLSSKTYEDVSSLEGKLQLRAELTSMLNQYLKTGAISSIYFTEFIVQ